MIRRLVGNENDRVRPHIKEDMMSRCYSIFINGPTINRGCVTCIACALLALKCRGNPAKDNGRFHQIFRKDRMRVRRVARSNNAATSAVDRVRPSFQDLSKVQAFAVLRLLSNIVMTLISGLLFLRLDVNCIIRRHPTSAAATTNVGGTVLQANVRNVFTVCGLQIRRCITLLTLNLRIKRTFPILWVLNTNGNDYDHDQKRVANEHVIIITFNTRSAMGPTILVDHRTRIMCVHYQGHIFKRNSKVVPRPRVVGTIKALNCNGRQLAIDTLCACRRRVLTVPLGNPQVRNHVRASAFRRMQIKLLVRVVPPRCEYVDDHRCQVFVTNRCTVTIFRNRVLSHGRLFISLGRPLCLFFGDFRIYCVSYLFVSASLRRLRATS